MSAFDYSQPTEIRFGWGRVREVGSAVSRFGSRCLLVTVRDEGPLAALFERVCGYLKQEGVAVAHFNQVVPNPTTDCVTAGAEMARSIGAQVVLGLGGGSSMDTAKAIAVEATHQGTAWDYLYFRETQPTPATLPIVAVSTTSGTGSQVTQVAVLTDSESKTKSAIYNQEIYPRVGIVDPELVLTAPPRVTAASGFDAFCHALESFIHIKASPYTDLMAQEAMRLVVGSLPIAVEDGSRRDAREALAWADTLAGLCIANAGVTLPHGIAMTIGGQCPHVAHGEALAVTYPAFTRFTYPSAIDRFAAIGRILDPDLWHVSAAEAAERSCDAIDDFLKSIGLWLSLERLGVSSGDVVAIADKSRVLPDYKANPRIASRDEIYAMLDSSFRRE